jgi:DNA primase large subunit
VPNDRVQVERHDYRSMTVKELKALSESFQCSATCSTVREAIPLCMRGLLDRR